MLDPKRSMDSVLFINEQINDLLIYLLIMFLLDLFGRDFSPEATCIQLQASRPLNKSGFGSVLLLKGTTVLIKKPQSFGLLAR